MEGEGSPAATTDATVARRRLSVPVSLPDELEGSPAATTDVRVARRRLSIRVSLPDELEGEESPAATTDVRVARRRLSIPVSLPELEGEESLATTTDARVTRRRLSISVSIPDELGGEGSLSATTAGVALPDELVVEEILRRLPAKFVIRAGAVCRFYRTATMTPQFRTAFHDRKPSLPLMEFRFEPTLETLDVLAGAECRRRVLTFDWPNVHLHASCDGLLLLSFANGRYLMCNPATREFIRLPELTGGECGGMYSSCPAGGGREYRVLFWKGRPGAATYFVLTVGSSAPSRPVVLPDAPQDFAQAILGGIWAKFRPAVFFQKALHWIPGSCTKGTQEKVVVFDTVLESFKSIKSPVAIAAKGNPSTARIFVMEDTLSISMLQNGPISTVISTVTIWALRDYSHEIWEEKHHVTLRANYSDHLVLSNKRNLLLYSGSRVRRLIHSDSEGNTLGEFPVESSSARITGHWYKEHLEEHAFFKGRKRPQPTFFKGI